MSKVLEISNYILDYLESSNVSVSNLKLQKLLYFSYGIYLQSYNTKLFENKIEAWMRGPVVEAVYKEFKNHKYNPITTRACKESELEENDSIAYKLMENAENKNIIHALKVSCAYYGKKSADELVSITHEPDTAWSKVYKRNIPHITLDDGDILQDFNTYVPKIVDFFKNKS